VCTRKLCLLHLLILAVLLPLLGTITYRWSVARFRADVPDSTKQRAVNQSPALAQSERIPWRSELQPVPNPRYANSIFDSDSIFEAAVRHQLMTAQEDPFLLALAAGIDEGHLETNGVESGIVTLGPPIPRLRAAGYSSRDMILHLLQQGVGGSFRSFYSDVFGDALANDGNRAETASDNENPFRRARESITDAMPAAEVPSTASENKTDSPASDPPSSDPQSQEPAPATSLPSAQSVTTVRPHMILRVGEDGLLQHVAASNPREGAFESVELGLLDFEMISFEDLADLRTSLAVADFNADGISDIAVKVGIQGFLRFFFAQRDGGYEEQLRINVGKGERSVAPGDFNRDGLMDIALSRTGRGGLTVLFGEGENNYRFKTQWLDIHRDYIMAGHAAGSGYLNLLGMSFARGGCVLLDFAEPDGKLSEIPFDYSAALNSEIYMAGRERRRLNSVVFNSNLALNLDNYEGDLTNVANIAAGSPVYVVLGDLDYRGSLSVAIATPRQ
jgi:hypothetical protein